MRAPVRAARTTARTCSSSASAPPATRSRTTCSTRASASSASTASRSSRFPTSSPGDDGQPLRADPRLRQSSTRELDERIAARASAACPSTASPCAGTRTSSRSSTSRSRAGENLRIYGGVRFGGTLTLDDAWALGFDHVAIAAGAGSPTIIDMKNNLIRGIRKASRLPDGAAAHRRLQEGLAGEPAGAAARASSSAAASPPSTPPPSCSPTTRCRSRRSLERYEALVAEQRRGGGLARAATPRSARSSTSSSSTAARSAPSARAPRRRARRRTSCRWSRAWGGVTIVYRRALHRLARLPPQPRGGRQGARGRHPLHREPVARSRRVPDEHGARAGAAASSGRAMKDGKLQGHRRDRRAAGAHRLRRRGHRAQRHLREGVPGHVRARRDEAVLPGLHARSASDDGELVALATARGPRRRRASSPRTSSDGAHRLASTATTTRLRGQRGQGDGLGEGRLPARRRALRARDRGARRRPSSRRATRSWRRSSRELDDDARRHGASR